MTDQENFQETIHVRVGETLENSTRFKIMRFMPLQKMFKTYAEINGLQLHELHFYIDGEHLHSTDTPASLEMEEDAFIFLPSIRNGPCTVCQLHVKNLMAEQQNVQETIQIKVGQSGGNLTRFKIKRCMPLKKLFKTYAEINQLQLHELRFYDEHGERLHGTDTPAALEMEEDALIVLNIKAEGGFF